jgi:HlyD family secretion protein
MPARSSAICLTIMVVIAAGSLTGAISSDRHFVSTALAQSDLQSELQTLIDKLRGVNMPEGIVKTNERIEATQVDIAAKYPGRLRSVTVEESDTVSAGQTIAVISSPEFEAQLRGAQAQVLKAKQALVLRAGLTIRRI